MPFSSLTLDVIALVWFVVLVGGYGLLAKLPAVGRASITEAVLSHRIAWMRNMTRRHNRMLDAVLANSLSQGNAFFASTSAIAIGGLVALIGSGEQLQAFIGNLPYAAATTVEVWEVKILFIITIFVFAFFKFAWAYRLQHYTAIMMGATPLVDDADDGTMERHARRCADLFALSGAHSNSGLRAFYYAIAGLAWFFHPALFMAATLWVVLILMRRDFFSQSRAIIAGD